MDQLQLPPASTRLPPPFRRSPTGRPVPARPAERAVETGGPDASTIVQSILDCIQIGAMAVGAGLRVSFANRAALRECSRHAMLRIEDTQVAVLALEAEADHARLAKAVDGAHAGHWSLVRLGAGTRALSVAVFPLLHNERNGRPLALLLFGLNQVKDPLAIQLYAGACGLTPAETRVLLGLAEGLLPKQIASKHAVLLSTVRTQISSIRDKTGTRRLADLMQALVCLPPLMPRT
jgi:DNA-binding CsgD family transcriptional regulator